MTDSPLDTCRTIPEVLARSAGRQPEKVALTFLDDRGEERGRLTLGELATAVEERAERLAARYPKGARLVLALPTGRDFVVLFLAAMRAGLIPVPAPAPRSSSQGTGRLGSIARSAAAAAIVTEAARGELAGVPLLTPGEIAGFPERRQPPAVGEDDIAFLQYSSGSTGDPKGVVNRHGAVLANERMLRDSLRHSERTVAVSWLPLFHDMGLIGFLLQSLCNGGHLIAMSPLTFLKRPVRWLEAISRYGAATSGAPSSSYGFCADRVSAAEKASLDLRCWTTMMVSAEPVRAATMRRFLDAFSGCGLAAHAVWTGYGLAEATVFVTGQHSGTGLRTVELDRGALAKGTVLEAAEGGMTAVSCGHAWGDLEVRIVDPESCRALDEGRIGEVWVAGATVAAGYWDHPAATGETFRARIAGTGEGPFLRTGDLGFLRGGELFITGRRKDTIIVEGTNVFPEDLEATIEESHPALRRGHCAVFGVDGGVDGGVDDGVDGGRAERIVAVAEVERAAAREPGFAPGEVLRAVRAAVAAGHDLRLDRLILVRPGTVPRTSSGKLQRGACRVRYLAGEVDDASLF